MAPMTEDGSSEGSGRSFDRQVAVVAGGILLVLALLAWLPDFAPPATHGLVSDRAHARIVSIVPASDEIPPVAQVEFVDGPLAGEAVDGIDRQRTHPWRTTATKLVPGLIIHIETQS